MTRLAPVVLPAAVLLLLSCSGSPEAVRSAVQACTPGVCGAPGAELTVRLTFFDHASDVLDGYVGASAVTFLVSPTTDPLPAGPCAAGGPNAELFVEWNATAPIDPFGHFDLFDYDGDYHRQLAKLARAGVDAAITLAPDLTTVVTLRPLCAPAS